MDSTTPKVGDIVTFVSSIFIVLFVAGCASYFSNLARPSILHTVLIGIALLGNLSLIFSARSKLYETDRVMTLVGQMLIAIMLQMIAALTYLLWYLIVKFV